MEVTYEGNHFNKIHKYKLKISFDSEYYTVEFYEDLKKELHSARNESLFNCINEVKRILKDYKIQLHSSSVQFFTAGSSDDEIRRTYEDNARYLFE